MASKLISSSALYSSKIAHENLGKIILSCFMMHNILFYHHSKTLLQLWFQIYLRFIIKEKFYGEIIECELDIGIHIQSPLVIVYLLIVDTRKYLLRGYILGVLTHTTAWDRLWGADGTLTMWL